MDPSNRASTRTGSGSGDARLHRIRRIPGETIVLLAVLFASSARPEARQSLSTCTRSCCRIVARPGQRQGIESAIKERFATTAYTVGEAKNRDARAPPRHFRGVLDRADPAASPSGFARTAPSGGERCGRVDGIGSIRLPEEGLRPNRSQPGQRIIATAPRAACRRRHGGRDPRGHVEVGRMRRSRP